MGVASVLGLAGVVASFLLFYLAEQVYKLDRDTIQSLLYLKLSVAGHRTVFVTRTRGPFGSIRPAKILLLAVVSTQIVATLLSVYGIFMAPLGWKLAGLVWVYAFAWFLVNTALNCLPIGFSIGKTASFLSSDTRHMGIVDRSEALA